MFKLGNFYNVSCNVKNNKSKICMEVMLKDIMFYKSTEMYYVFWTGRKFVRIRKVNLIKFNEK